jgi:hypothetical protein
LLIVGQCVGACEAGGGGLGAMRGPPAGGGGGARRLRPHVLQKVRHAESHNAHHR